MRPKAQSAMEYLLTYGWTILIVAVVLGTLFSIGVFSGAHLIGTSCIASPGFYCGGVIYSHSTDTLTFVVGQITGTNWASVAFLYAPQATAMTANGIPAIMFANTLTPGLSSDQTYTIMWPLSSPTGTVSGATTAGSTGRATLQLTTTP